MTSDVIERPELFIALVGAVGTNLQVVQDRIGQELAGVGYETVPIRLSEAMVEHEVSPGLGKLKGEPEDIRIDGFMEAGDQLRSDAKSGEAVALLGISTILNHRENKTGSNERPAYNTAYILNSLKHPDEVRVLRSLYRDQFILISVYSPINQRKSKLISSISRSRSKFSSSEHEEHALRLISKDQIEPGNPFGQNVRDTFPLADVFFDMTDGSNINEQVERFVQILFSHPYRTPTRDEYGMFHAKAAALRSADLSRQVGAVIASDRGEIITTGCNEVPIQGGGSVWEDDCFDKVKDNRDFKEGYDSSARMKRELVSEVFEKIRDHCFSDEFKTKSLDEMVDFALFDGRTPPLKGSRIASLLEFGRIVHAEMSAITEAARRGLKTKDTILYCTTFPCHVCARHIIASGIVRVVYIEPYPKSMAKDLYGSSIQVDNDTDASSLAVKFIPFTGISPRRFIRFFEMTDRKDSRGHVLAWNARLSWPRVSSFPDYVFNEITRLNTVLESLTISPEDSSAEG